MPSQARFTKYQRKAQPRSVSDNIEREARRFMAEDPALTVEQAVAKVFADEELRAKCHDVPAIDSYPAKPQ